MRNSVLALACGGSVAAFAATWIPNARLRKRGIQCSPLRYALLWWRLRRTDDLIIVADFDRTITTASCGVSCHGVLERCKALSQSYR